MNGDVPLPLEEMPLEIRKHLSVCDCSCDHMGFGNYQVSLASTFLYRKNGNTIRVLSAQSITESNTDCIFC